MTKPSSQCLRILAGAILAASLASPLACGEFTQLADCTEICSRYSDCVVEIDISECADRCEDLADADPEYEERADRCEDCIEFGSCSEIRGCWDGCPVVAVAD
jgi:hypothetical protein